MAMAGIRRGGSSARLQALTRRGVFALAALVVLACAALAVSTTASRRGARRVIELNETLRAVDAMRIALSRFGREAGLAYVTERPAYVAVRDRGEAELLAAIARAHEVVREPQQNELLARADAQIHHYLAVRKASEARRASNAEVLLTSQPAIEAALDTLHEASRVGFEDASRAERRTARNAMIENVLGIVIAASLLVGFVVVAVTLRRFVLRPLLAVGSGIDRFAAGDRAARVVPEGAPEVRHTTESFNEMASSLERQHQNLLTFLAGVAHDLRTPLAAMRLSVGLLARSEPEEGRRKTTAMIDRQLTRLERMVGDFLDAARIESGHLELQLRRCDLRALVEDAVALYTASSREHHLVYAAPDAPVEVRCDGGRLAQVLNNLVSNAIKYSPLGGDVCVTVAAHDGEGVVAVEDSGIGIAADDVKRIFEPFRRTGASRETAPGVGLGLSVARQIVAAHGGRIEVQSAVGQGSTFRLRLPLAAPEPDWAPSPAPVG